MELLLASHYIESCWILYHRFDSLSFSRRTLTYTEHTKPYRTYSFHLWNTMQSVGQLNHVGPNFVVREQPWIKQITPDLTMLSGDGRVIKGTKQITPDLTVIMARQRYPMKLANHTWSQPHRNISGLNTNFVLSPSYSFHKSYFFEPIYIPRALDTGTCIQQGDLFYPAGLHRNQYWPQLTQVKIRRGFGKMQVNGPEG